jgi:PTH1 family peptidyl-tRNA hydrolase
LKYIIGLGNPEDKYLWTRHNIGFAAIENTALSHFKKDVHVLPDWKKESVLQSWVYRTGEVTFLRPLTYVNETGRVISALMQRDRVGLADFLFVCDDVNLVFGKLRLRAAGSAGGHHGLESIIQTVGSEDFNRLRIGVGRQDMPKDLTNFVLQKFDSLEMKQMETVLAKAASVCREWVERDFESAMKKLSVLQGVTSQDA